MDVQKQTLQNELPPMVRQGLTIGGSFLYFCIISPYSGIGEGCLAIITMMSVIYKDMMGEFPSFC